mgnify:FL=1|tara:strand:- start:1446 stop:1685 length:240 start_codon:yes stop_codon:yes gene_type:complete
MDKATAKSKKQGDLVFMPANTSLFKFRDTTIVKITKTDKPAHVLLVQEADEKEWSTVLFEGESWSVEDRSIYKIRSMSA